VPVTGPLSSVRVLEFAAVGAVPHAAMMLSDAGADVLRLDRLTPGGDPGDLIARGRSGNAVNRGRRSVAVDLKHPQAAALVLDLVDRADVLLDGFRPGVLERLGVGPEPCLGRNPALVYGRLTGWGQSGPLSAAAGHDINYVGLSGTLSAIGPADQPPAIPLNLLADFGGGSNVLAFGVVAALIEARATGRGQVIDAAMVDGAASLATYIHSMRSAGTWVDARQSNVLDGGAPFYNVYETSDAGYMAVGAIESQFYALLVEGLGFAAGELPDQLDRTAWPAMREQFRQRFASRTRDEWCQVFDGVDACVTPVLSMQEAPYHPHLLANSSFVNVDGAMQPAPVPRFMGHTSNVPAAPVAAGIGGRHALADWGLDAAWVDAAVAGGAVAVS
jgi:alpha-methylacyl-CoA racemase